MTKQMQLDPEDQHKIFGILHVLFPNARFYLFGSRARGQAGKFSDADIAIDEGQPIRLHRIGEAQAIFKESDLTFDVDVLDMHDISEALLDQIKKEGILWKT